MPKRVKSQKVKILHLQAFCTQWTIYIVTYIATSCCHLYWPNGSNAQFTPLTPTRRNCFVASVSAVWTQFATSSRRLPTDSVDNLETDQTDCIAFDYTNFIDIDNFFNNDVISSGAVIGKFFCAYTVNRYPHCHQWRIQLWAVRAAIDQKFRAGLGGATQTRGQIFS